MIYLQERCACCDGCPDQLTPDERNQLADKMVELWRSWQSRLPPNPNSTIENATTDQIIEELKKRLDAMTSEKRIETVIWDVMENYCEVCGDRMPKYGQCPCSMDDTGDF